MKQIYLTQGKKAQVDDIDFEWLNQWKWYCDKGYAVRNVAIPNGKQEALYMHRLINQTPKGSDTDHINRNKLDNRRSNLRTATRSLNIINRNPRKDNKSGFTGVNWDKQYKKWRALIRKDRRDIQLGLYSTITGAWLARRLGERIYYDVLSFELKKS